LIDGVTFDQVARLNELCLENYSNKTNPATDTFESCIEIMNYIFEVAGNVSYFDGRKYQQEWNDMLVPFQQYLGNQSNQFAEDLYMSLHVENSTRTVKFLAQNAAVMKALGD
jgi:hypothetical protein